MGDCKTILLVEDTPELLETLRQVLESAGYSVICASDGGAALKALRSGQSIDVLVTDHMMPDISGCEVIEIARQVSPRTKMVMMSGGRASEFDSSVKHLQKPFTGRELLAKLQEIVS